MLPNLTATVERETVSNLTSNQNLFYFLIRINIPDSAVFILDYTEAIPSLASFNAADFINEFEGGCPRPF